MKDKLKYLTCLFTIALLLSQCTNLSEKLENTVKFSENDPFKETIIPSQKFKLNADEHNVVEGKNGTILILPKGCFKNPKGETVTEDIILELAEALSVEDMLLSNLTTTSNGNILETDGMIYINATANGQQLTINKENPIHIEVPTVNRKAGMMAYKGIRDNNGNMNWIEPKELKKYLTPIDINLLNFYPEGFEAAVNNSLPYRNYDRATKKLIDSLYYSFAFTTPNELLKGLIKTDYNEPYYNIGAKVVDGKYTNDSYQTNLMNNSDGIAVEVDIPTTNCGIDPAIIKTIKDEKFQNTLISTKEFETRLQLLFKSCRNDILEMYITNLDKNLWELDSTAFSMLGNDSLSLSFLEFSKQGLTKVKQANTASDLLRRYYERQFKKVKSELEATNRKALKELNKESKIAAKTAQKYRELLFKREKHRMETYGFEWTETGWVNIDNGTIPKTWGPQRLEIIVENGNSYDRVHTYVIYTSIKSLYRLNSNDKELFFVGNIGEKKMLMPKKQLAIAVSIGYKDELQYLAIKKFVTGNELSLLLKLSPSSISQIKNAIKPYNGYGKENRIDEDLKYMEFFAEERKRQDKLQSEFDFLMRLWAIANPCCTITGDIPDSITK